MTIDLEISNVESYIPLVNKTIPKNENKEKKGHYA